MVKACPLCGELEFVNWQFGLLRCRRCALVVAGSVWQPAANERLNDVSFGGNYDEPVRSFWVRMFEALNNRRTMRHLGRIAGTGKQLLEIGVGSGSFLAHAKRLGYTPLGCDLSPTICGRVEQSTGVRMHCGLLESLPDQQRFDVVVMNHVLEHVSDPVALLKAVRMRLYPNGVLRIAVPNVDAWEARLPGWNSYEPYHLIYFTPDTLRRAAEMAGFKIRHLATHESFSGWFLAILRTLLRKSDSSQFQRELSLGIRRSTSSVEHVYRLVMVIWGLLTLPFRRLQEFLGSGDEVILLAVHGTDD